MTITPEPRLAGFRAGDHVCHPFFERVDHNAALIPFIREGLLRGERCVFAGAPSLLARTEDDLRAAGVDVARERERQALMLIPSEDAYGHDRIDADRTIA